MSLHGFSWRVARSGYRLVSYRHTPGEEPLPGGPAWRPHDGSQAEGEGAPVVALVARDEARGFEEYQPLADRAFSGLFMTFADTPATEAGVRSLADRYGLLGLDTVVVDVEEETGDVDEEGEPEVRFTGPEPAELFVLWRRHILALRQVVDLWRALRIGDAAAVADAFEVTGPGAFNYRPCARALPGEPSPERHLVSIRLGGEQKTTRLPLWGMHAQGVEGVQPGGDLLPAVRRVLLRHMDVMLRTQTCGRMYAEPGQEPRVHLFPKGLLGALWMQLAEAFQSGADFLRCAECGSWIERTRGGKPARYCGPACKMRAYRARRSAAG